MTTLAQTITPKAPRPGLMVCLQDHLRRLTTAYARQARFASLDAHASKDTGLPPEAILAEPAHDPALPFFLQASFDRAD